MVSTTPAAKFKIDIFRTGYYNGLGARLMTSFGPFDGQPQPVPEIGPNRLRECKWKPTTSIKIPHDWPSGVYLGKLTRDAAKQMGIDARNFALGGNAGSDHESFQRVSIDTVFFSRDYSLLHTPQDTMEKLSAESLKILKGYEVMRAPFSGTITARFVDPGALVQSATTNQTAAQPLVTLSQTDRLRIYVYLDQKNAGFVKAGDRAVIVDAVRSDVQAEARVSRISGELDPKTRTLLTELDLDNRSGRFLAGGFVQVTLKLKTPALLQVPPEALLQKGDKTFVGIVGPDNRVAFRQVTVADSDGPAVRPRGAGTRPHRPRG